MLFKGIVHSAAALALALAVAGCKSSEERAEEHLQNAMSLLQAGDTDRAIVEFRNVFKLDGGNVEAHRAFGDLLYKRGDLPGAYREYLQLVEREPQDAEANIALAQIALDLKGWEDARRYGEKARELAPEDKRVKVIDLNLRYMDAIQKNDDTARRAVVTEAKQAAGDQSDNLALLRIEIDGAVRDQRFDDALAAVDAALKQAPEDRALWNTRLALLAQLQKFDDFEAGLRQAIALFPDDDGLKSSLLRYYVSRNEPEKAESFLRELIGTVPEDKRQGVEVSLIQFLESQKGADAALAEVDKILAEGGDKLVFGAIRGGLKFQSGDKDAGIAETQALLDGAAPSEQTRRVKIGLAKMLIGNGNPVGARRLVEEVLAEDGTQSDALKMKAAWLIQEDKADDAIALLRTALDQKSDDVEALTLMAQAYDRNGDHDLARDTLSLAADASKSAPEPSIRYATALMADKRYLPAEEVLIRSLRLTPNQPQLLTTLGQLYLDMEDWPRAEQVETTLRGLGTPETMRVADGMKARRLSLQGQSDESIAFLESLAGKGEGDVAAQIAVIRARLTQGDRDGALAYAKEALAAAPDNVTLQYALASVQAATGDTAAAEAGYRDILKTNPQAGQAWLALVRLKTATEDSAASAAVIDEGLKAMPDNLDLLWAKSGVLEKSGDIEGAIALNEKLYEMVPNSPIIANNLASLISSYRDDPASLDRAYAVARRLKGTQVAAFQDTYGWIAYRRGDIDEAVSYLEPAASGLPGDPLVQLHLGMAYLGAGKKPEALGQLKHAVGMVAADDGRAPFKAARDEIAKLEAEGVVPVEPALAAPAQAPTQAPDVAPDQAPAPAPGGN